MLLRYLRHIRRSEQSVHRLLQHRLRLYQHQPRKPVLQKYLHICLHFSGHRSAVPGPRWINIVMWWRGDQAYTWCGMTCFCNPRIYFLCRKMSAFTRFCTLCHLDLDFSCRYQITAGNTETSTGYLFDRGTSVILLPAESRRSSLSPPSPVLDFPCRWFIAIASVSCAS